MDYNNRMKKSNHSRSKEYLATVMEDREGMNERAYHSKRQSEDEGQSMHLPQEQYLYTHYSHISANSYQNRQEHAHQFHKNKNYSYQRVFERNAAREKSRAPATTETIAILAQRLQNIHEHYKALIEEQKLRNIEKTQSIFGLVDELQTSHQEKIQNMRRMIEQSQDDKKEVGVVDDKMNEIKNNIEELINQSSTLKEKNEILTKKIEEKRRSNDLKETELQGSKEQVLETRNQLEQFQIKNIKNNRVNKEIIQILKTAASIDQIE